MGAMLVRHEPAGASDVRRELVADLQARGVCEDAVDAVALVASELVGNAIRHTSRQAPLNVNWSVGADQIYVSVEDPSTALPQRRDVGPEATSGRGLMIVETLSTNWGVDRTAAGKRVWARVPIGATA